MTNADTFILSNQTLLPIIEQINAEQWTIPVPANMSWQPNQTLRDIVNYHAYDDAWVPDVLAGKTAAQVGDKYEYLRTSTNTLADYRTNNRSAIDAVKACTDFTPSVHLSYGDFTADEYLAHIILFRGLRAWDISKLIGIEPKLPDELIQALRDIIKPREAELRAMHVIGEALPAPDTASSLERLMAMTGRK